MSRRLSQFRALREHAWYGQRFRRLSSQEIAVAEQFIEQHDALDRGDFEMAVNRMFVDRLEKPKNWTLIMELLTVANGHRPQE